MSASAGQIRVLFDQRVGGNRPGQLKRLGGKAGVIPDP